MTITYLVCSFNSARLRLYVLTVYIGRMNTDRKTVRENKQRSGDTLTPDEQNELQNLQKQSSG
jgi:hypothetical protein